MSQVHAFFVWEYDETHGHHSSSKPRNGNGRQDTTGLYVTILTKSTADWRGEYALSEKVIAYLNHEVADF